MSKYKSIGKFRLMIYSTIKHLQGSYIFIDKAFIIYAGDKKRRRIFSSANKYIIKLFKLFIK